jgi:hypothetical protein
VEIDKAVRQITRFTEHVEAENRCRQRRPD